MKNILDEKPDEKLLSRLRFTTQFIKNEDIKNKKILDIGCGYGWFELNALKRGVKEIHGIEISEVDLKTVKDNIKDKRAKFKIGGALKLPFKDSYFDTVVSWEVIEHIPKKTENKMFSEVRRVLKKNGVFYLSTPYDSLFSKTFDPAYWLTGHRHYSNDKLIKLGAKNKMKTLEIHTRGGYWNLIGLINMYISKWIFRRKPFLQKFFELYEDNEYGKKDGFMGIFIKYKKTI